MIVCEGRAWKRGRDDHTHRFYLETLIVIDVTEEILYVMLVSSSPYFCFGYICLT